MWNHRIAAFQKRERTSAEGGCRCPDETPFILRRAGAEQEQGAEEQREAIPKRNEGGVNDNNAARGARGPEGGQSRVRVVVGFRSRERF